MRENPPHPSRWAGQFLKQTTSFGVQFSIRHSFSKVSRVIFFPFFKLSKVLLSIPFCKRAYWETPFDFIVSHNGL